jgi:hypothetical protein
MVYPPDPGLDILLGAIREFPQRLLDLPVEGSVALMRFAREIQSGWLFFVSLFRWWASTPVSGRAKLDSPALTFPAREAAHECMFLLTQPIPVPFATVVDFFIYIAAAYNNDSALSHAIKIVISRIGEQLRQPSMNRQLFDQIPALVLYVASNPRYRLSADEGALLRACIQYGLKHYDRYTATWQFVSVCAAMRQDFHQVYEQEIRNVFEARLNTVDPGTLDATLDSMHEHDLDVECLEMEKLMAKSTRPEIQGELDHQIQKQFSRLVHNVESINAYLKRYETGLEQNRRSGTEVIREDLEQQLIGSGLSPEAWFAEMANSLISKKEERAAIGFGYHHAEPSEEVQRILDVIKDIVLQAKRPYKDSNRGRKQ